MSEKRIDKRLRCWESVFDKGQIEGCCPVCRCSTIRYNNTSGTTFQQLHIISHKQGGTDESWNLLPGCGCNQNMRYMNLIDWMGTRGNKQSLMKDLFLRKYKSLVPPCNRSLTDKEQLLNWLNNTYHPQQLALYRDWLILLDIDLWRIHDDEENDNKYSVPLPLVKKKKNKKKKRKAKVVSPYFLRTYKYSIGTRLKNTNIHPSYGIKKRRSIK